jgi:hypothetical protein
MNGPASRGDEIGTERPVVVRRYQRFFLGPLNAGRDDERHSWRRWRRRLTPKIAGKISVGVIQRNDTFLDSFQYLPGISLELLENAAFPFASRRALKYR